MAHFGASFDWPLEEFDLWLQFSAIKALLSLKACSFFLFFIFFNVCEYAQKSSIFGSGRNYR